MSSCLAVGILAMINNATYDHIKFLFIPRHLCVVTIQMNKLLESLAFKVGFHSILSDEFSCKEIFKDQNAHQTNIFFAKTHTHTLTRIDIHFIK